MCTQRASWTMSSASPSDPVMPGTRGRSGGLVLVGRPGRSLLCPRLQSVSCCATALGGASWNVTPNRFHMLIRPILRRDTSSSRIIEVGAGGSRTPRRGRRVPRTGLRRRSDPMRRALSVGEQRVFHHAESPNSRAVDSPAFSASLEWMSTQWPHPLIIEARSFTNSKSTGSMFSEMCLVSVNIGFWSSGAVLCGFIRRTSGSFRRRIGVMHPT